MALTSKLAKALLHPNVAISLGIALLRGFYCRWRYALFTRRLSVTKRFCLSGPGVIVVGDDVECNGGPHPVTLFTHSRQAEPRIGNNVFMNGTRFGCSESVSVGDDCILADCRIFDTDMHSVFPDRRSRDAVVDTAPVCIERNVWIGAAAIILKGVTIGENSVVGAGAVVTRDIPPNCIAAGNPARVVKHLQEKR